MSERHLAVVILAAGQGTRMKSDLPKVLHKLAGRSMIQHLLDRVAALGPERVVVVVGPGMEQVAQAVAPVPCVVQAERLGTGHAVLQARQALAGFTGDVLVLFGDSPLITSATLDSMVERRRAADAPGVVVLGFEPLEPGLYGRLVEGAHGLEAIVEAKDATDQQKTIRLCNSGFMALDGARMWDWLDRIGNANAAGEYYLTDVVSQARRDGATAQAVRGSERELMGVNSRAELALAEAEMQNALRAQAMAGGATLVAPETVWFSWDTKIGRDVVVAPQVIFGPGVEIGDNVIIKGFCHFEGCRVAAGSDIGPFARLRPGAVLGEGAHIGNFVEIKQADIQAGAKVNHLSYVGDATVGAGANVGAGTITCNYDGFTKSRTTIGAKAFIGSNTALVAPVTVGEGAMVGAGSVITQDVAPGALAVARGRQAEMPGWAERFRTLKAAAKAALKSS